MTGDCHPSIKAKYCRRSQTRWREICRRRHFAGSDWGTGHPRLQWLVALLGRKWCADDGLAGSKGVPTSTRHSTAGGAKWGSSDQPR